MDIAALGAKAAEDSAKAGQQAARIEALKATSRKQKLDPAKVEEAAVDFEAVFLSQMLQHMFEGIPTNEVTGGGSAEDIYRSMMLEEYGKLMAKAGGVGIADQVKKEMLKTQEVQ